MKEVSKKHENYRRKIKRNSPGAFEVISSLRSQIGTLQKEVYFLRDQLKEKNTLIKSLIAPYTLITIEHKEHKTKELNSKSTIDDKTSINSKEISKTNNNMASEGFRIIDSIDFHVNKLAPENDTSESKNHVLLPLRYEDEYLATQAAASTTTTTATINSTNSVNKNNSTLNDTNSILILSSTTTTATNNKTNSENTNNNTVSDSNKLLK